MFYDWLRFDKRIMQFIRLWDVPNIFHIYGWWIVLYWPLEWMLGSLHIIGFSHFFQLLLAARSTRKMSHTELKIGQSVFSSRIQFDLVRINTRSTVAKKWKFAFVTGNIIHINAGLSDTLLVHELTHVFQYQSVGLVYVPRALFAQRSRAGYNFGHINDHLDIVNGIADLGKLNYEQQAEFLETLYRYNSSEAMVSELNQTFNQISFRV